MQFIFHIHVLQGKEIKDYEMLSSTFIEKKWKSKLFLLSYSVLCFLVQAAYGKIDSRFNILERFEQQEQKHGTERSTLLISRFTIDGWLSREASLSACVLGLHIFHNIPAMNLIIAFYIRKAYWIRNEIIYQKVRFISVGIEIAGFRHDA